MDEKLDKVRALRAESARTCAGNADLLVLFIKALRTIENKILAVRNLEALNEIASVTEGYSKEYVISKLNDVIDSCNDWPSLATDGATFDNLRRFLFNLRNEIRFGDRQIWWPKGSF